MVRKCSTTFNTETSKIHELKQEKVKATNKVIQAPCHFLWTKLTEVAAAVWAHLTHSCVRMWWNMYRMYILFLYLAVLSLLKGKPSVHPKVNIQQVLDMHQSSYKITVCPCFLHIHLHTHTPPLPIPPGSQQWLAALHSYRMGWAGAPAPLLSWYWNTKTCAWLPSHIGRSKPCMGADLVKSHRMAFLAGGIMPGIAMGHPEESITKCQSSGFMNAIHKVPWLLAFCKACCKTLRYSSVHTLKGGLFLSYSTVWAAWDPWGPKEDIMHSFTEAL